LDLYISYSFFLLLCFFSLLLRLPPTSTLFPYTTLFRSTRLRGFCASATASRASCAQSATFCTIICSSCPSVDSTPSRCARTRTHRKRSPYSAPSATATRLPCCVPCPFSAAAWPRANRDRYPEPQDLGARAPAGASRARACARR